MEGTGEIPRAAAAADRMAGDRKNAGGQKEGRKRGAQVRRAKESEG